MNIQEAKGFIKKAFTHMVDTGEHVPVHMVSPPGLGKSSIINQLRDELQEQYKKPVGLRVFHASSLDPIDARGVMMPYEGADGELLSRFSRSPLVPGKDAPEMGILFLDERGQATQDVQKPLARLVDERRIGDFELPPKWTVVSASNRQKDKSGVNATLAMLINRECTLDITPSLDAWVVWAESNGVLPEFIAFAKARPNLVFSEDVPNNGKPFCTPRTLIRAESVYKFMGGTSPIAVEAMGGFIGDGVAAELSAFLGVYGELVDFETIVANPEKAPVPDAKRLDAMYAVSQMLAHNAKERPDTLDKVFTYARRLPVEFATSMAVALARGNPTISANKHYTKWVSDHSDMLSAALSV